MHSAVVGIGSSARECERISEATVVYSRIKYSVWIAGSAGGRAMIVPRPSPHDGIAHLDVDCTWNETGAALSDANVRRRRGSRVQCCRKHAHDSESCQET